MKKILFAAAAVAALASCATDEVVSRPENKVAIEMTAFVDNATRAATDINVNNLADFGVYGSVVKGNDQALIFKNTVVSNTNGAFTYSPVQYWVEQAKYTFTAFAPFTNAKWAYAPSDNKDAYNGVLSFNNAAALGEQDLIFASAVRETPDAITAAPEKVGFTFGHLLSKVAFKYTNGFTDGNITLNVYDIKINNTAATGEVAIADGVVGAWTDKGGNYARSFGLDTVDASNLLANKGGNITSEHFYVIPVERAYNITFKVDLIQAGVRLQTYEHEINTTINFEKGKSYSISAILTPENVNPAQQLYPIEFKVDAVADWVNADVNVDIPENVLVSTPAEFTAAVAEGKSVILANDVTVADGLIVDKNVDINLNGKTLNYSGDDVLFRVNGSEVNIYGTDGAIVTNPTQPGNGGNGYVALVKEGGVVNFLGGSYVADDSCTIAQVTKGTVNVYGGEFKVNMDDYTLNGEARYLLNCSDTPYKNGEAVIKVYGGKFFKFNPANNAAEGVGTNFCAAGYTVESNGDWYTVVAE